MKAGSIFETTTEAVALLGRYLANPRGGCLTSLEDVQAVAHRVVHGGEKLNQPMVIDAAVKDVIRECFDLAPLHNPPNLEGIEAAEAAFPKAVQVGIFDTAFHSTIPAHAFMYALPLDLYRTHKIRRYGFHGISHQNVSQTAAAFLGRKPAELNLITCHLGNGCSMTAVKGGRSVDTSMGLTPLEGLVMGTRCGDLDPAIVIHLMEHQGISLSRVNQILNKKSGLLGLSGGKLSDLRDIIEAMDKGDHGRQKRTGRFLLPHQEIHRRLHGFNGRGGCRCLYRRYRRKLAAGAGKGRGGAGGSRDIRRPPQKSSCPFQSKTGNQSRPDSPVKVLVIPTREEREIAGQAMAVLEAMENGP